MKIIPFIEKTLNKKFNILPPNSPNDFIEKIENASNNKVILNIGDSITHGFVSHNYSKIIEIEANKYDYEVVNAGINADLAYSVVQRIDRIIACQPDIVTLLIGTNDIVSSLGGFRKNVYQLFDRIPKKYESTLESYLKNLNVIVKKLKTISDVKIYIYSLPIIGEDLTSTYNQKTMLYSESIKKLSIDENLYYLPLNETMKKYLTDNPSVIDALKFGNESSALILATIRYYLLYQDWNQVSQSNKLQLTTDTIHLNEKGAEMVAELALEKIIPILDETGS